MANSSASTIIERAWKKLRKSGSSTDLPALQEAEMLASLQDIMDEWRRAFSIGSGEPPITMRKETGIDIKAGTTLASDQASGATTAVLTSATNLDTAGAYVVYDDGMPDVQENTGKASDTLSGVTGSDWAHESGDQVIKLYALPSNFHSFRSTPECRDGVQVNNTPYSKVPDDPKGGQFALYDNGTTKYLWLPPGLSGSARVFYNKNSTTIDDTNDLVDWAPEYDAFGVWRLVEMGGVGEDVDMNASKIAYAKAAADKILAQALSLRGSNQIARTRPINRNRGLSHDDYYRLVSRDS